MMPKFIKCWYKDCDSDNRVDQKLLFYKFPKDLERREQWVISCANEELTNIWKDSPAKLAALRVCQKHFLKEFLGSSSRLVGHAVPAPYGIPLDIIDAKKFMVECAGLKSSPLQQKTRTNALKIHSQESLESNQISTNEGVETQPLPTSLVHSTIDLNVDYAQQENDAQEIHENMSSDECSSQSRSQDKEQQKSNERTSTSNIHKSNASTDCVKSGLEYSNLFRNANPKINYDREGKVISIQYPTETLTLIRSNEEDQHHNAHVTALKHKVRYYQRKLAVINHRYLRLRSQMKGRSNKARLIESLKSCKANFNPVVFDIFLHQIKGPSSKHGNRWSNEVKLLSSSLYLHSISAYKLVRKTFDLPSESIVKRYIALKKLTKVEEIEHDEVVSDLIV